MSDHAGFCWTIERGLALTLSGWDGESLEDSA